MRNPRHFPEGDDRFHKKYKTHRKIACDGCEEVFEWNRELGSFDGQWEQPEPPGGWGYYNMKWLWETGNHDCTWICTNCRFDVDEAADDIVKFRDSISRRVFSNREKRTIPYQESQRKKRRKNPGT